MATTQTDASSPHEPPATDAPTYSARSRRTGANESPSWTTAYRIFGYFGVFSVQGAMLFGFPHDPNAPATAYLNNLFLYLLFAVPHLLMTRSAFKRWVWGTPSGSPAERRTYIVVAILTWIAVLLVQWPTPGPVVDVPEPLRFVAMVGFLYFFARGFEGVTLPMLDGLLAVPGAATSFSHGPETPLFMEGQYAEVRHPMYRAAILGGLCTLVIHPHLGQLVWSFMIGATLVGFVPIEEAQLLAARGEIYRDYQRRTPYRIFRGIW